MKRIIFDELGGPEVLKLRHEELPPPAAGEVRVRIEAIGLNRYEAKFRQGFYPVQPVFPSGIGAEAAGVVEALGEGVDRFAVGDRVTAVPFNTVAGTGAYAEYANIPATCLLRSIEGQAASEEAVTWMAALNAYNLVALPKIAPGATVLTTAATSAIGIGTIQIARDLGATVIATTRKREKVERLLKVGAHHVIVTGEEPLTQRVLELTGGQGVDLALDAVAGELVAEILAATKVGGLVRLYGVQSLPNVAFSSARLNISLSLLVMKTITYSALFQLTTKPDALAEAETYIREAVKRRALTPMVERIFRLDDIIEAHRYLDAADLFGKIVVVP